jgi:flagellar hook-basal body complex protein FliE
LAGISGRVDGGLGTTIAPLSSLAFFRPGKEDFVDSIKPLAASSLSMLAGAGSPATAQVAGGFGDALKAALESVNQAQGEASDLGRRFQMGDTSVSLEETMIAMQKSSISFAATVQARNRLMSAYHDIMNMQV